MSNQNLNESTENYLSSVDPSDEFNFKSKEVTMRNEVNENGGVGNAATNNDASHEGADMEKTVNSTDNHTESAEVSGTNNNNSMGGSNMEQTVTDKQVLTPYQKLVRKSYGISNISNAKNLQSLRNDVRSLKSDLIEQLSQMKDSLDDIEDPLDQLAHKDEIDVIQSQVEKLDEVLESINNRVASLLQD